MLERYPPADTPATIFSRIFNSRQAAAYLGLCPHTLKGWRRQRVGPPWFRLPDSRAVRYDRESIDRWIADRETTGVPIQQRRAR